MAAANHLYELLLLTSRISDHSLILVYNRPYLSLQLLFDLDLVLQILLDCVGFFETILIPGNNARPIIYLRLEQAALTLQLFGLRLLVLDGRVHSLADHFDGTLLLLLLQDAVAQVFVLAHQQLSFALLLYDKRIFEAGDLGLGRELIL